MAALKVDWAERASAGSVYTLITIVGLTLGGWLWSRRFRSESCSFAVFIGAIAGAYLGAKLLYLAAEGWMHYGTDLWLYQLAAGKTIVGALLGGYGGVEIAKKLIGYSKPTGDWFAVGVPLSIAAGRLGCLRYGCCPGKVCAEPDWLTITDRAGVERWPAVPLELGFNLLFVAMILPLVMRRKVLERSPLAGQLFHLYLVTYGIFRFWHEFHRETPTLFFGLTGYQFGAVGLIALGVVRGISRARGALGSLV
ncbi:MAG: prolipoprotein diacylglyceryl transferase [Verrucomicrobiales bacterium]|nr:prolipoprotein diacylglyceryl transferase [Verrucomicrobiales bacterium]